MVAFGEMSAIENLKIFLYLFPANPSKAKRLAENY